MSESNDLHPSLSEADIEALDRLMENGLDVGLEPESARDQRVLGLLSLLGSPVPGEESRSAQSLAKGVLERAAALETHDRSSHGADDAILCEADREALDAWALRGYDASKVAGSLRERAEKHEQLAGLLSLAVAGESDQASGEARVRWALARVQASIDSEEQSLNFDSRPERSGLRFRLPEIASLAAVVVLGVGLAVPVFQQLQRESRKSATAANFASAGSAFGQYGSDHDGSLPVYEAPGAPVASAGVLTLDMPWWNTGEAPEHSNTANLFTLVRTGYAKVENLASPGNAEAPVERGERETDWLSRDEVSYSYRVVTRTSGGAGASFTDPSLSVLLADRSPLVVTDEGDGVTRSTLDVNASSPNHGGRGQYVLRGDNSAEWVESPWLDTNDNLWLPRWVERGREEGDMGMLTGRELPEGPDDAFVGP